MSLKIRHVDIQNFQGYVRWRIPLTGFTIMVGKSSSGKTSVFRALRFLAYGEWEADYPHDPEKSTAVAVEFEDGTRVIRMRKPDGKNLAAISKGDESVKYHSFGDIIPGIQRLINVAPIDIGTKKINLNFSQQDDPTFMLSESKPAKAQWIGRLYGAHIITQVLRDMAKDKKNAEMRRKEAEKRLKGLQEEMGAYATLEQQEAILGEARALLGALGELQACVPVTRQLEALRQSYERDRHAAEVDTREIRQELEEYSALSLLRSELLTHLRTRALMRLQAKTMDVDAAALRSSVETLGNLYALRRDVQEYQEAAKTHQECLSALETGLERNRRELGEALVKDGKCPVCGNKADMNRVSKNLRKIMGGPNAD